MSLVCYDGFDHYNNDSDFQSRVGSLQWFIPVGTSSSVLPDPTGGRNGTGGIDMDARFGGLTEATVFLTAYFNNTTTTAIVGMALNLSDWQDPVTFTLLDAQSSNTEQVHFVVTTGPAQIKAYRGGTLLGSSLINIFSTGGWNYFEFKTLTSNTAGTIDVHVNGQGVGLTLTGIDTQQSANAWVSGLLISASTFSTSPVNIFLDDFYVCDGTPSAGLYPCNDFLGNVRVDTTFAVGDSAVSWTPISGTNWQQISDTVFDGDGSYNFTNTPGNTDLFNFGPLLGTVTGVIAVQTTGAYRLAGAGSHTIVQKIDSGGTIASGASWSLTSSYQYFSDIFLNDPHTGTNWGATAVNAMTLGYDLTS